MKGFAKYCVPEKEKKLEKLMTVLDKTNSRGYYQELVRQSREPTAVDFPKLRVMVTRDFVCSYEANWGMVIIPLREVKHSFLTNICNRTYSFDNLYIALETTTARYDFGCINRKSKALNQLQSEFHALLRQRIPAPAANQ